MQQIQAFFQLRILLVSLIVLASFIQTAKAAVVPEPDEIEYLKGSFLLNEHTAIVLKDSKCTNSADYLTDYLLKFYHLTVGKSTKRRTRIELSIDSSFNSQNTAYTLKINRNRIVLTGSNEKAVFYGIQTLIQLLPLKTRVKGELILPAVRVEDSPRFSYRGLHLDVARHYFPVSFIKKYIDFIALHKMNYFHWHLTDDQGWRIEIKKYPELTNTGSCRRGTMTGKLPGTGNDNTLYCHFYTQDEIREVIDYASKRYITVIPEIEMPGHASAALASYPSLGCPGTGPYQVEQGWGVFEDVYCAGNDSVYYFLQDVLDEVLTLFPSVYIHAGGDECPKKNWRSCIRCQKKIKDEGLKDVHQLQSYFVQRMERYINSKGRILIGWDEILEGGLATNAVLMSWRGIKGGIEAAKQQHHVIMTPGDFVYLNHSQTSDDDSLTQGCCISLQKVYEYEPVPKELSAEEQKYIMGSQANLWTEYINNEAKAEYLLFPRVSALSEVLWSQPEKRSWKSFEKKLQELYERYELWKVNYYKK